MYTDGYLKSIEKTSVSYRLNFLIPKFRNFSLRGSSFGFLSLQFSEFYFQYDDPTRETILIDPPYEI